MGRPRLMSKPVGKSLGMVIWVCAAVAMSSMAAMIKAIRFENLSKLENDFFMIASQSSRSSADPPTLDGE